MLILHLKRFIYDPNLGLQKLNKKIEYGIELEIQKRLISQKVRDTIVDSGRLYRLFAVINHGGIRASAGHYVADVYHHGYNAWLRYDDAEICNISENEVLRHKPSRVAYLLFYQRSDTLLYLPPRT